MPEPHDYYSANTEAEWNRLDRHRTEFAVTLRALHDHLPPAPAEVIDIGGGPGRYAIALAGRGYQVTLVDLVQANLTVAEAKARDAGVTLSGTLRANALDLAAVPGARFDAALIMGPLYHLLLEAERLQAVREAARVLKPGGVLAAAFVTRFAPFRDSAQGYPEWLPQNPDYAERLLATGVHDDAAKWASAHFAHPDEIVPLMERAGLRTVELLGCEGVVAGHEQKINALTGEAWERWVDFNYRVGHDPSLRGAADHLLYIGRKP